MSDAIELDEKLRFAIGDYWDIAKAESSDQRDTDDEAGSAQAKWSEIDCLIRQLAEQRAELLEALQASQAEVVRLRNAMFATYSVASNGASKSELIACIEKERDAYEAGYSVGNSRAAIANATQQRNATGGEG